DTCHPADTAAQRDHLDRMAAALRYEPCAPTCANWLRYGVQPQHPRKGMTPGRCRGKAHQRATLGFGGRRVLVSRKWSGKNLADHRADRRRWVLATLGGLTPAGAELSATADPDRYLWDVVRPGDDDAPPRGRLILHALSERLRWQAELRAAQAAADGTDEPATSDVA
ncbi:MAG: replication initiator protein, partial [Cryptosporangiaceae bacterium]|nr:replication initiator protein [Cryptosporangiaceae bacterium]